MSPRRRDVRPVLPVPAPHCPICDRAVDVRLCGATPRTAESVTAIQAAILAMHDVLAGHVPDPRAPRT